MMIEWMAYATLLTAFICCAAAAGEHAMAIWRGGRRFVWLAALIIATVIPTVLSVRRPSVTARAPTVGTQSLSPEVQRFTFDNASRAKRPSLISLAARSLVTIDPYFRGAWIAASLILLSLFARATIGLRRQRSQWREIDLAGERLLLAPDAGPAVVGVLHPQVVVPHWALLLDPTARTLMLRHEAEHIRARDPQLLVVAALALVLFPWNAGLWFVVRRMRLAIEVDCDERVLRGSEHAREYGLLLLTVGARHSASLPLAVSLAERRPFLERRIRAMTTPRPRKPLLTSLALTALVIVATTAASVAPRPSPLASRAQRHELPPPPALRQSVDAGQPPASVSAVAIDTAVRAAAPRDTGATKIRALVAAKLPTTKRVGEITPELIRALLILHHPNLFADDATSQVVTMVFDHNQNYAFSYLGKEAFGELPVRASSLADALEDSAKVMKAKEMAEMKMMRLRELKEPNVGDVADTAAIGDRKAALEKQLVEMVGMSEKLRPEMIDQMQSYKFAAGAVTPGTLAVIVIVLKERSGT